MANFKKVPSDGHKGKISYNTGIVNGIVSLAVSEISGVSLPSKNKKSKLNKKDGIRINIEKGEIYVDVSVLVDYGYNVPDVAFKIQENIKHNVESMSEFKIANIDVHVLGVLFKEETAVID